jgi:hypothetical protein
MTEDPKIEIHEREYFGIKVRAFTTEKSQEWYASIPWRFEIDYNGKTLYYFGMPNYVETKAKALKRAWWRAKWLYDGVYDQKYKQGSLNEQKNSVLRS